MKSVCTKRILVRLAALYGVPGAYCLNSTLFECPFLQIEEKETVCPPERFGINLANILDPSYVNRPMQASDIYGDVLTELDLSRVNL